jgi:hypothetical protein
LTLSLALSHKRRGNSKPVWEWGVLKEDNKEEKDD